jgi:hypothetical protein
MYDKAAATKQPLPIPSRKRQAVTRYGADSRERRRPLAVVMTRPDRMRGTRPMRSDSLPAGSVLINAPKKYAA